MGQKECLEFLKRNGASKAKEIAEELGVVPGTVMDSMRGLNRKGYVKIDKSKSPSVYLLTDKGAKTDPEKLVGRTL